MKWIVLVVALAVAGCNIPEKNDLNSFPTHRDVKDMQTEDHEYIAELIGSLGKEMTDQHAAQTPEKKTDLEIIHEDFVAALNAIKDASLKRVEEREPESPFTTGTPLLDTLLGALAAVFGVQKLLPARNAVQVAALEGKVEALKKG